MKFGSRLSSGGLALSLALSFWSEIILASNVAQVAHAKAAAVTSGKGIINLINGTPYDWVLDHMHEYQMFWWFPKVIPAGTSWEGNIEFSRKGHRNDAAAEATFTLKDAPSSMSFSLIARVNSSPRDVSVQYHQTLSSLNNPEDSKYSLGFENDGGIVFTLAGDSKIKPFVSSNPPVAWMQATLDTIGPLRLRDVAIPASHDSGIDTITHYQGGVSHNTITQSRPIYDQLKAGARVFDIRPILRKGIFNTAHLHIIECKPSSPKSCKRKGLGGYGRTMQEVIDDLNRFNSEYPGELIILNISHDMSSNNEYLGFNPSEWQQFYDQIGQINNLFKPLTPLREHYDPSDLLVSELVQPGSNSTVLLRRGGNPSDYVSTSAPEAWVFDHHWWLAGSYSDTRNTGFLIKDQREKLENWNKESMFQSIWTLTQNGAMAFDIGKKRHSVINLAKRARKALYAHLWPSLSRDRYPNIIEIDDFKDSAVTALCMAINRAFAHPDV